MRIIFEPHCTSGRFIRLKGERFSRGNTRFVSYIDYATAATTHFGFNEWLFHHHNRYTPTDYRSTFSNLTLQVLNNVTIFQYRFVIKHYSARRVIICGRVIRPLVNDTYTTVKNELNWIEFKCTFVICNIKILVFLLYVIKRFGFFYVSNVDLEPLKWSFRVALTKCILSSSYLMTFT